ncbi:MAG TPA: HAMP domain-containing sensor histidine kinase [Polyangiaceae bacterium]|nr:HAMP domain-containing sensor histidine kinase [Polyangiaceae bacterium]
MAVAIALVVALGYWDVTQEWDRALADFAQEQATLAQGLASAVSGRARALGAAPAAANDLLSDVRSVERPASLRLLLVRPGQGGLSTSDGHSVRDAAVERAVSEGTPWVRLERNEAPAFGLPRRTAVVGIAGFDAPQGNGAIVVAATALRMRDRELRAQWRSVGGTVLASGLVLLFGGMAMRRQRKELELAGELAIKELEHEREEELVHVDKLATMAALATGIAHEVSTPLGVIVGRAEQLLPKVSHDARAKKSVESIIDQGTRIDRVVRGFLNLARGQSPTLEHVSPRAVVEAVEELVEHRFEKAGVRLEVRLDRDLPDVACDPRLLEQVLINLLLNACDACEPGGHVELLVRADSERVGFVVTDDGSGITPEAAARATEPFFTTKPAGQGTGLGLAIANEIVKHHGGDLSIAPRRIDENRNETRGTRASVDLPAVKRQA